MATTTSEPAPRRRLSGWKRILALAAGIVLLPALLLGIGLPLWLRSDADLRAVDARAAAAGMPASWADLGWTASSAERLALFRELEGLSGKLKPYRNLPPLPRASFEPGSTLPTELVEHHAGLDPVALGRALELCDPLGEEPLVFDAEPSIRSRSPDILVGMNLGKLLRERIALAPPDRILPEAERLLALAHRVADQSMIHALVRCALYGLADSGLRCRLADLRARPDHERRRLAETLSRHADREERRLEAAFAAELLQMRQTATDLAMVAGFNAFGSNDAPEGSLGRIWFRAGRAAMLDVVIECHRAARVVPSARRGRFRDLDDSLRIRTNMPVLLTPSLRLRSMVGASVAGAATRSLSCCLRLRLVAAELLGAPWPADPFDPAGAPLRRIERDGRLIGAYSVGTDGVDDGGDRSKDERWALYAPLDPPAVP